MGFCTALRTRHVVVALKFASIPTALSKAIPQGKRRLDRHGAV